MFDRAKRIDFVTGFKKRKDERRQKAKVLIAEEKKQERKDILKERKQHRKQIEE